ncbi:MAG TPA: hypothetical protein VIL34_21265 [Actinopolymorphaceae bacterium]|jgi:hypothetical protein
MGLYDEYEPSVSPTCPWCGTGFRGYWQGKDGPNAFFLWRQGDRHPVDQPIDEDARMDPARYTEFVLPAEFRISNVCEQGHMVEAVGRCVDGVWQELDLSSERRKVAEKAMRDKRA